jgi:hypothetical protein
VPGADQEDVEPVDGLLEALLAVLRLCFGRASSKPIRLNAEPCQVWMYVVSGRLRRPSGKPWLSTQNRARASAR